MSKIRLAGLETVVRKMAAEGHGAREIAARLAADYKCEVTHTSVLRFLREESEERRKVAATVSAATATETITLADKAARGVLTMAMNIATREYNAYQDAAKAAEEAAKKGEKAPALPSVTKFVATGSLALTAARTAKEIAMGEDPSGGGELGKLQAKLADAVKARAIAARREAGDTDDEDDDDGEGDA